MKNITIFAATLTLLGIALPAHSAEMTLVRTSRPVTEAEVTGGAPSGGMVHDFYATSDTDLFCMATSFSQRVYQHPYGCDNSLPNTELIASFPAVAADSFFTMPSSTLMLGGGFTETEVEKFWADLSNDGPLENFLFGRLTTTEPGSLAGFFALRGQETYVVMPFSFTLPGPLGTLTETILVSGFEQPPTPYTPPEPSTPTGEETTVPEPRYMKPSRLAELTSWMVNLPEVPAPPTNEILTFKASLLTFKEHRQQSLPQSPTNGGTTAAIPEPAAWTLALVGISLLLPRRP